MLADIIEKSLDSDEQNAENSSLKAQFAGFEQVLIKDIKNREFADVYAQTIAYGMFAARLYDDTLDTFSRQEAAELIPKSNPFLRKLFSYISGIDIDDRIKWIVDSLADVFRSADVKKILEGYGKSTKMEDPIIHFYETFLSEYDPKLRKARGVWYTPHPVVNFIIRAIDEILKTEFGLAMGLADSSKIKIKEEVHKFDERSKTKSKIIGTKTIEKEVHKVQILDPATGTGTFLVEFIKEIFKKFKGQEGLWNEYVEKHLIPRLNGFELLMASYAMAHLKLDLLLKETGYKSATSSGAEKNQRLKVFLTNSLEAPKNEDINLFMAQWLSQEASEADVVKSETPVMVVAGNPPYAVSSTNKGEWIQNLIADYKKDLNERKINLDDDYIKFIRYGQHFIDKNGSGILAYISNNSFLDGITHRQMRKHLLESFDKIYILDLHGNAKKKETTPDGSKDENVFDIQQGVSINLFVKTNDKKNNKLGEVFHYDLFGKRSFKYNKLKESDFLNIKWSKIKFKEPYYFFIPRDYSSETEYNKGLKLSELFILQSMGILTSRDDFVIDFDKNKLSLRIEDFANKKLRTSDFQSKYNLKENYQWKVDEQRMLCPEFDVKNFKVLSYRPFDNRIIYYQDNVVFRSRRNVMKHLFNKRNISLNLVRAGRKSDSPNYFVTKFITDKGVLSSLDNSNTFLLYVYPEKNNQQTIKHDSEEPDESSEKRTPNLDKKIVAQMAKNLGLAFVPDHETLKQVQGDKSVFTPLDVLDYIYAVLHSPTYRETYKEFLKIDFPRVPYPKDKATFWQLVKLGGEIRQLHLLESKTLDHYIISYPISGNNEVTRKMTKSSIGFELTNKETQTGKVWINDEQYFDKVPKVAWEFYIGGYQPAQKWLKDRNGRTLGFEDIIHYQKMIVALTETDRLMKEIDEVEFMEGDE